MSCCQAVGTCMFCADYKSRTVPARGDCIFIKCHPGDM